jgi:hypothetical protein
VALSLLSKAFEQSFAGTGFGWLLQLGTLLHAIVAVVISVGSLPSNGTHAILILILYRPAFFKTITSELQPVDRKVLAWNIGWKRDQGASQG